MQGSWTALWTPGRIVLAGLGGGFAVGLLEPGKRFASGRNALQMLTAVAGLFAGGSAQAAANEAGDAAEAAQEAQAGETATATGPTRARADAVAEPDADAERRYREAGLP